MIRRRSLLAAFASLGGAAACSSRRLAPGEVALWFSYGGKNREVLLDLVQRFNASQRQYRVIPTYQGDYFEALAKVRTALAAGLAPGLTHVVGEVLPYLAEAGVLEPLDGYEGSRELGFVRAIAQEGSYQPGAAPRPLWGVPFNRSTPILYLNGALLGGRPVPRTWEEQRELARALTDRSGTSLRWGYEVPISWWFWVALVGQAGGEVVAPSGEATLGGEAGEKALRYWQRLVHEDKAMRPPPGRDYNAWQVTNQDFLAGRAAFIWTSTAFLRYLEENAKFPVIAAPLPGEARAAVPTGGTFFVMMRQAQAAEKEAGWAFLRWMSEPEQAMEWAMRTGYLPVTEGAVGRLEASGFYRQHPNDRVAYEQLRAAQPWPWAPTLFRVQRQVVEPRLEEAVLRNEDAGRVLEQARAEARSEP
jgi:sn-glycerol 3-phosphate transport system substrate-binding protein